MKKKYDKPFLPGQPRVAKEEQAARKKRAVKKKAEKLGVIDPAVGSDTTAITFGDSTVILKTLEANAADTALMMAMKDFRMRLSTALSVPPTSLTGTGRLRIPIDFATEPKWSDTPMNQREEAIIMTYYRECQYDGVSTDEIDRRLTELQYRLGWDRFIRELEFEVRNRRVERERREYRYSPFEPVWNQVNRYLSAPKPQPSEADVYAQLETKLLSLMEKSEHLLNHFR